MPDVPFGVACRDRQLLGTVPFHPRQLDLVDAIEGHQTTIVSAGRRGGKSRVAAAAMVWSLLLCDRLDRFLTPHEPRFALGVATAEDQAGVLLGLAAAIVKASPVLRSELVAESGTELQFRHGRTLRVLPCNARSIRGRGASVVVLDEFGHFASESDGPAVAGRVWAALAPSVSQFGKEGKIIAASTPGDAGGLHEILFLRAEAGELPGACSFRAGSAELNPGLDQGFVEAQRAALGDAGFEREILALFTAGGGSFFDEQELRAVTSSRREALPDDGHGWICAIDPSSGGGDPFACVVVGRDARPGFEGRLLVGHVERWQPRKTGRLPLSRRTRTERDLWVDSVLDSVAAIAKRFRATVVSDQHVPGVILNELRKRGVVSVRIRPWTGPGRTDAFQAVRARVATGRIELTADEDLVAELRRARNRFRGGGSSAVEIGRVGGSHGDLALALVAAVAELDRHGVGGGKGRLFGPTRGRPPRPTGMPGGMPGGDPTLDLLNNIFRGGR